jgi:hypothetical protein
MITTLQYLPTQYRSSTTVAAGAAGSALTMLARVRIVPAEVCLVVYVPALGVPDAFATTDCAAALAVQKRAAWLDHAGAPSTDLLHAVE